MRSGWLAWIVWLAAAGCERTETSLLLEIEGPAVVTDLVLTISIGAGTARSWTLPESGNANVALPTRIVVQLPAVAAIVTATVTATASKGVVTASSTIASRPNHQVVVPLGLLPPGLADMASPSDATDLAIPPTDLRETFDAGDLLPQDLASGDLPPAQDLGTTPDLRPAPGAPIPRVLANAYFTNYFGATFESPTGMSQVGYEIPTAGVVNGELLLFVATIDNNGADVWPNPFAPGFTQLTQVEYGIDGQNYVVAWKIANNEPATYTGSYGSNNGSGSVSATLLAVSGVNPSAPIHASLSSFATGPSVDPVVAASVGVTTTVANCTLIHAAGADWATGPGSTTFSPPTGYTQLAALGDHGGATWDWSAHQITWATQATAGPSGAVTATFDGTHPGLGWSVLVAIAPP